MIFRCCLFSFFLLLLDHALRAQVNLTSGLVAYYSFDGNSNDASGNSHHGLQVNGVQLGTDRFGNQNSAYSFDGIDDYIKILDNGAFSTPNFSLVIWFQTQSDNLQCLVGKRHFSTFGGTGGGQYQFFINYPPFPGIGSNIVGNTSTCTSISSSSYMSTTDWICRNKWYCAVVTFDGINHKIFIDGVLKKTLPTSFNGFLSCNSDLRLGNWWQSDLQSYKGLMDDVRWYNRALNQQEVTALYGNYSNISGQCSPNIGAGFLTPDTVCVNTPVPITNISVGASDYYWNFCVADVTSAPTGVNIGNTGAALTTPVYIDHVYESGNYYAFQTNNFPGKLLRLDFGNSLLNTPAVTDLGTVGGIIPNNTEGVQVVKQGGNWYVIIVGGDPAGGTASGIVRISLGNNITNNSPTGTNWGNIGNLAYPHDLYIFEDNARWYGLTVNTSNNTITRFDFTTSFTNTPSGVNLGNVGSLTAPTGVCAFKENGNWYAFVTNANSSTLTRLNFGNSLLNIPTGVNLGNIGGQLNTCWDVQVLKYCGQNLAFIINASSNDLIKLDFGSSVINTPTANSFGNIGNLNFPHCLSKFFRVGPDIYTFIPNVINSTITRLKFTGCTNANIPNSTLQNPLPVLYNAAGTYNINLTVDEGLPSQSAYCKQVVVVGDTHTPVQNISFCNGDSLLLTSSKPAGNQWSNGSAANSIYVKSAGTYWVQSTSGGCINIDSFIVSANVLPFVNIGIDTSLCNSDILILDGGNSGASYLWQNGQTTQTFIVEQDGLYYVTVTKDGCIGKDSITISPLLSPLITLSDDTTICKAGAAVLTASGGNTYSWFPAINLYDSTAAIKIATPDITTKYYLTVTSINNCTAKDSVTITVIPKPIFTVGASKPVLCEGDTVLLSASGGSNYMWSPSSTLANPFDNNTAAFPQSTTLYKVIIKDEICDLQDSLFINLPVVDKPNIEITKSNDINCFMAQASLDAGVGNKYLWRPSAGLSDSTSRILIITPTTSTTYYAFVTTSNGCEVWDSVTVNVNITANENGFPVATAFTPNNDGKNDCFGVKQWGTVSNFSLNLYNRWGELIFHSDNPSQCWNGFYKNVLQPSDVYVYWIKAKTICGDVFRKGTFVLIR